MLACADRKPQRNFPAPAVLRASNRPRVSELASIRVEDVDLDASKIFIERGNGDADRYILFPESFRLALKA